jgi:hypothetical protein
VLPILDDPSHPGKDGAFGHTNGDAPVFELFDHETDPNETTNVAPAFPEVLARLAPRLEANAPSLLPVGRRR